MLFPRGGAQLRFLGGLTQARQWLDLNLKVDKDSQEKSKRKEAEGGG